MDLKDLNNYQLVLLTLLVSFVTSIATGILTVYLLQEASPQVTGVINHIVERTIETVAPSAVSNGTTQTIIISEDDLVSQALAQGFKETGVLYQAAPKTAVQTTDAASSADAAQKDTLVSTGVLVDTQGTFIASGAYTASNGDYVKLSGGTYAVLSSYYDKATGLDVIALSPQASAKSFADISPEGFGPLPKVGQTALVVGEGESFIRSVVSKVIPPAKDQVGSTLSLSAAIESKYESAPVFSGDGKIIGMVFANADGTLGIIGADGIESAIQSSKNPQNPK